MTEDDPQIAEEIGEDSEDAAEPMTDDSNENPNGDMVEAEDTPPDDDAPQKMLKRDEFDLLKSGNEAINRRLEAIEDDYRDKGFSEDEIRDRLAADRWNIQKEFLEEAFPGQDVSPNVFNGFSENGAKDRIADVEQSETLRDQLNNTETEDQAGDAAPEEETSVEGIETEDNSDYISPETESDTQIEDSQDELNADDEAETLTEDQATESEAKEIQTDSDDVANSDEEDDGTDWERTSLRPEEEEALKEMTFWWRIRIWKSLRNPNCIYPRKKQANLMAKKVIQSSDPKARTL